MAATTGRAALVQRRLELVAELGAQVTRTNALEALGIAGFVRGLSTRDVEATRPRRSAHRPPRPARR
jgi:hypothetical protein